VNILSRESREREREPRESLFSPFLLPRRTLKLGFRFLFLRLTSVGMLAGREREWK